MILTCDQLHHFYRHGYLVIEDFLTSEQVGKLQAETRHYHDTLSAFVPPGVNVSWEPRTAGSTRKIQQILNAHKLSPLLNEVIRSDRFLDVATSLIGPDIALFEAKFLMKSSQGGGPIPWHQDFAYWREIAVSPLQVNCLVYIDDADEANGCLQVIPGSHTVGLKGHARIECGTIFTRNLPSELIANREIVSLPGKAGSAVLFGPLLMHASGPNLSGRERRSFTVVYTDSGSGDHYQETLREREQVPDLSEFFFVSRIRKFSGPGPHAGQCASNYRRRELWKLAVSCIDDPRDTWIELSTSISDGDSFEWLAARKAAGTPFFRFERYPSVRTNRTDACVDVGFYEESLKREDVKTKLGQKVGIVHFETGLYFPTKQALRELHPWIRSGTILVFDKFYGYPSWERQAAAALYEFTRDNLVSLDYLGRADSQVAVRVNDVGDKVSVCCRSLDWSPTVQGIDFDYSPTTDLGGPSFARRSFENGDVPSSLRSRLRRKIVHLLGPMRNKLREASAAWRRMRDSRRFVPVSLIPQFRGDGPREGYCPTHARRKELWRYTVSLVNDPRLCWCEFGVGEGESLDWFALHKPKENVLFGFDSFQGLPEPWMCHPVGQWKAQAYVPNRNDIVIVPGMLEESLERDAVIQHLGGQIGLLHIDCDLYSSTKTVFTKLRRLIGSGTVIIFDEFYGYCGWEQCEAKAFNEFVMENQVRFEYIARSDFQIAVQILDSTSRMGWSVRPLSWEPNTPGITIAPL